MKANLVGAMDVVVTTKFATQMGYQFAFTMMYSHQKKGQDKNNARLIQLEGILRGKQPPRKKPL